MIKFFLRNTEWEFKRATDGAAGFELRASDSGVLQPGDRMLVPTGLHLQMPLGIAGLICSRSGIAIKHGVVVLNAPGVIDSDYRGEVKVSLINFSREKYEYSVGDRIAHMLFVDAMYDVTGPGIPSLRGRLNCQAYEELIRVSSVDTLDTTERGDGGHGSTGR